MALDRNSAARPFGHEGLSNKSVNLTRTRVSRYAR
jgi:hypothetical protein